MINKLKNMTVKEISSVLTTVLTALGAFYLALAQVWGLPFSTEVVATVGAVVTFISAILGGTTVAKVVKREDNN